MERGLGADRIADILAAKRIHPDRNLLIIDFGTATTFDMIKDSTYMGGCIIPGINLSINALFNNTAKLPKIKFEKPSTVLGINTVTQINSGIFYSNVGAIKELIAKYKEEIPRIICYIYRRTGKRNIRFIPSVDEYIPNLGEKGIFEFYKLKKTNKRI